ncbi:MAG: RdgB/HAM1 family non-canonical purine NTP pyrophosphatase [Woeseiaceae bacterium]|nr:RdgB/HAM1 family non-canonical purine NTP pyrophosphatase [Woeseiaceae bacterium]
MSLPRRIVFASGNPGKLREVKRLLEGFGVDVVPQSNFDVEEADETGTTFLENSLIKSRHAAEVTGLPAIADDSGLAVDALGGAPGVYSARYSGPDATDDSNIDKLLADLDGVADSERTAAFHCVASFVDPETGDEVIGEGVWPGRILTARQGDGGFGYDPVFFDPQRGKSAALFGADEKNAASHRGQALRALVAALEARYERP